MSILKTEGRNFVYDGKEIRLISGAIHYFRVVPGYWKDRLLKLKACGFNTVETYVAWNIHEPKPGQFNFEGIADIASFIETAGELGLHVIVRPGPYICAEWELGGLPSWLLADTNIRLRCYNKPFLDRVDRFYDVLFEKLTPLLSTKGGPIIAVQVENEYGSYGNDKRYLQYLKDGLIKRGVDVLLFTSDGPTDLMLEGGTLPGVLKTANFGSKPEEAFKKLLEHQPDSPLMCMEFWNGWFDHWQVPHHTRDAEDVAEVFEKMLSLGASVNFYMFHGGTNFGFYNGANHSGKYAATVTSYDYDCLLSEAGDFTEKYHKVKSVVSKYKEIEEISIPPIPKKAYGKVQLTEQAKLFDSLGKLSSLIESATPEPMEYLGQDYGYILYTTKVTGVKKTAEIKIRDIHDRGLVFVNSEYAGVIERWGESDLIKVELPEGESQIDILVENMGRVNYGPFIWDLKGIVHGVVLDYQHLFGWNTRCLPMDNLSSLEFSPAVPCEKPSFYRGTFEAAETADTFINMEGWTKGIVFVNGFNLGRYWNAGPQKSLYVPGPLLKKGTNEIIVFELHGAKELSVTFEDTHNLG